MQEKLQSNSILSFLRLNALNLGAPISFSLIAFMMSFVVNFFMTQIMSTELYGDTMLALTWITILGSLVILGIDQSSRRFITTFLANEDLSQIQNFISWGLKFITTSLLISWVIGLICYIIFDPMNIHSFEPFVVSHSMWTSFFAFILIVVPIVGLTNWMSAILICYKNTSASTFVQYLITPIVMTTLLAITYNFSNLPITPFAIRRLLFITFVLVFISTSLICIKLIPNFIQFIKSRSKAPEQSKEWRTSALKQVSNILILNILISLDFIIAGAIGKSSSSLGMYNIALTVTSIVALIPSAIFQYLIPEFETSIRHPEKIKIFQIYWDKTLSINMVLVILTALLINAYIDPILHFFGPQYIAAKPLVRVFLVGYALSSMIGCPGTVLQYTGHVTKVLINYASGIVLMLILALLLSMYYGLVGVAIAKILAWIWVDTRNVWSVHKHLKLKPLGFL